MPAPLRLLFALPGFHRFERGAEIALLSVAREFAKAGDAVTVIGAGEPRGGEPYRFIHAGAARRERFESLPNGPMVRDETSWEELTWAPSLLSKYRPADYDITVTCAFPYTNMILRRPTLSGKRPQHVFVTQNGDWPAVSNDAEYRLFGCDGLVCTNPDYLEHNRERWRCALIPNGIALDRYTGATPDRARFGVPADREIVLMVSAMIPTKRVAEGIRAVAAHPKRHLVVAGDGPLRDEVRALANELLPGRFTALTTTADAMPALYRSADVFLHMSKFESFGNVFVEAMASGLPIVGHDTPRLRWIVGDDEFLCDTTQEGATSAALDRALAARHAPVDARIARAGEFAWDKVAARYRAFFHELLAAH